MDKGKGTLSGKASRLRPKIWLSSLLCATVALVLASVALWAEWNIQCISFDSRYDTSPGAARVDRPLDILARRCDGAVPGLMRWIGFRKPSPTISLGLCLIFASGFLLAFLSRKNVKVLPRVGGSGALPWRFTTLIRFSAIIAGAACLLILLVRVSHGQTRARDILLWIASVVCFGVFFADRPAGRLPSLLRNADRRPRGSARILSEPR